MRHVSESACHFSKRNEEMRPNESTFVQDGNITDPSLSHILVAAEQRTDQYLTLKSDIAQ